MRAIVLLLLLCSVPGCVCYSHSAATEPDAPRDLLTDGISPLGRELAHQRGEDQQRVKEQHAAPKNAGAPSSFLGELFDGAPTFRDLIDELGS
jgi:hypothetical protein